VDTWLRILPPSVLLAPRILLVLIVTYEASLVWKRATLLTGFEFSRNFNKSAYENYKNVAIVDYTLQATFCFFASCILLYKAYTKWRMMTERRHCSTKERLCCLLVRGIRQAGREVYLPCTR
jgi:hypothetical protein